MLVQPFRRLLNDQFQYLVQQKFSLILYEAQLRLRYLSVVFEELLCGDLSAGAWNRGHGRRVDDVVQLLFDFLGCWIQ